MLDSIIYKILDKIVNWCERYKEYKIKRSLPKATYDEKAKKDDLKKCHPDDTKKRNTEI